MKARQGKKKINKAKLKALLNSRLSSSLKDLF